MTAELPASVRYSRMRWNAPLSEEHARLLMDLLNLQNAAHLLDLGCGWGELLCRGVAGGGAAITGTGVDLDGALLERGRSVAVQAGVAGRVRFVEAAAAGWAEPADRLICIGASHAWGGTAPALRALRALLPADGQLLYGDGCWEQPPAPEVAASFDEVLPLGEVVESALAAGLRVMHLSTADRREWDEFESAHRAGREDWLRSNLADPRRAQVRDELDEQLRGYVTGHRGQLGFCYLVCTPDPTAAAAGPG